MKTEPENAAELRKILTEKDNEIVRLKQQVEWLTQQFKLMQARQFGSSSEKTIENADQLSLFNEAEATADPEVAEPELEQITYARKKQKGKREADFSGLPTEQIIHELPESERVCPDCGGEMHACGHDVFRRELTCFPAQYKVTEHVQTVYSCRHCERTSDHVPMKKSKVPAAMMPGSGIVSPSLLAQILHNKYTLALPLYRQEQELKRIGVNISRQNMANWVIAAHERWFAGLFNLFHDELLKNGILHADETTLQVLHEDGRKASQKSYVWLYGTSGDAKRPVVLYDYQPSRAGECASSFLNGFAGKLHTDGYDAYHCKLPPEITVVGCWAHMRRKFTDALKTLPPGIRNKSPAQIGLGYCNQLFGLEADYTKQGLDFDERYRVRLEKSKPVAEAFFAWAKTEYDHNPTPKTIYGVALTYTVNQKGWLMNVFLDGRLELSNNRAERSVRPFAVGRKNWLFCNTPKGADASAAVYSIIETAKANGLKPFDYLKFLLERLPYGISAENCLPWSDAAQTACR
ncbi:MAG: IS66 family transposase [Treponema sp.]|nr:IS66 family transposase [Treponema sp.]